MERDVPPGVEGIKSLKERLECLLKEAQDLTCTTKVARDDVLKLSDRVSVVAKPLNLDLGEVQRSIVENISFFVKEPLVVHTMIHLVQALDVVYRIQCMETDGECGQDALQGGVMSCMSNIDHASTKADAILEDMEQLRGDVDTVYKQRVTWEKEKKEIVDSVRGNERETCRKAYLKKLAKLEEENNALSARMETMKKAVREQPEVMERGSYAQALHKLHDMPIVQDTSPLNDMVSETRGYLQTLLEMGVRSTEKQTEERIPPFPQYSARVWKPQSARQMTQQVAMSRIKQERANEISPYLPANSSKDPPQRKRSREPEAFTDGRSRVDGAAPAMDLKRQAAPKVPARGRNTQQVLLWEPAPASPSRASVKSMATATTVPRLCASHAGDHILEDEWADRGSPISTTLSHRPPVSSTITFARHDRTPPARGSRSTVRPSAATTPQNVIDQLGTVQGHFDPDDDAIVMTL